MLNVVIINGGRGASAIIPELLKVPGANVTSIVNAYDDGKSTGEIRRFFNMLGPSDIRKVQELMLPIGNEDYERNVELFRYRFPANCQREQVLKCLQEFSGDNHDGVMGMEIKDTAVRRFLKEFLAEFLRALQLIERVRGENFCFSDCSLMNCTYAGAFLKFDRNMEQAARFVEHLFNLRGSVLPTSIENKKLVALRENGEVLYTEAEIVELRSNVRIERIYLLDEVLERERFDRLTIDEKRYFLEKHHCYVEASPKVRAALSGADVIVYAAGTQHSSLYPSYLSPGLARAIADNHAAVKVFLTNIGADYETPTYKASDYIHNAFRYLDLSDDRSYSISDLVDSLLVNYNSNKGAESYVECDRIELERTGIPLAVDSYESLEEPGKHNGRKVVAKILELYQEKLTRTAQPK